MKTLPSEIPVLIVGAGPIGLALAAYLGKQGVRTLLIERNEDKQGSPKMIVVSVRTMEFCRQMGLAPAIHNWGFPLDHGLDSVFVTSLQGYELGRVKTASLRTVYDTPFSPERERPCPQTWFDPILKECATAQPSVQIHYQTSLNSFEQDESGVTATVRDAYGRTHMVRARYLVGADGYSSTVRRLLGIQVRGTKHLDVSMSIYLTIPKLAEHHKIGDAYRFLFVGKRGVWCVLTTMDGRDFYRLQLIGVNEDEVQSLNIDDVVRRCIGEGIEYQLGEVSSWIRKATVADRFADGNVFIAGDAAHAHPPNGGLGMNTGILDAWDLGWKLSASLKGWGGRHLLNSYDIERRPASARACEESLRNYGRLVGEKNLDGLHMGTPAAAVLRQETGRRLVEANEKAWHPIGIHLGYVYSPSPVVIDDGSPPVSEDQPEYVPSAQPGCRAPHVWLVEGEHSILDYFGPGFTLLKFRACDTNPFEQAAAAVGMPLTVVHIDNGEAASLYQRGLVLVRPDGHVAWRADEAPLDCRWIIDKVRGEASALAARWHHVPEVVTALPFNRMTEPKGEKACH
jgi:2-polyprenyl-6-methoxyphenol hydroxylase-like FAD-dependent oxidoreductase